MKTNNFFGKIFDAFPPPKFLDIPFAGVHISDLFVRVLQFGKKNGALYIEKYKEVPVPPGTITAGQIDNREVIITILKNLKQEMDLSYVKVSLPEEKAYLFTTKIPIVKETEVRSAVESKIEENVPVSPNELVFDYKVFDHRQKDHLDVVVSALPINLIDSYADVITRAGLLPISLEIESEAIVRSIIPKEDSGTSLVVNFAKEKVGLYVETFRVVRFTSTISTKGYAANDSNFLLQEIKKLYMYWHTLKENVDKPEKKITQIILCGESFDESILPYLASHMDIPVVMANVWTSVFDVNVAVPKISFSDSLRYAGAIGLALPQTVLI